MKFLDGEGHYRPDQMYAHLFTGLCQLVQVCGVVSADMEYYAYTILDAG
jgi:hypothetical protein